MGCAVPYAIAAKFAYPDRPVIALVGDGAMQMNGLAELITIAKYWDRWADPRLIVMVLNNRDLAYVTWEERVPDRRPEVGAISDASRCALCRFRAARSASMACAWRTRIRSGPAWDKALAADRPFVLDMVTDPNVPPLPPHITLKQARHFMGALAKGDPEAGSVDRRYGPTDHWINPAFEGLRRVDPGGWLLVHGTRLVSGSYM